MIDQIIVFDDLRKFPAKEKHAPIVHCIDETSFLTALDNAKGQTIQVILDHDLGGVAFGPETARTGISKLIQMHRDGEISVDLAVVVTMNPVGMTWIKEELRSVNIHPIVDPGGKMLGMIAPEGF